MPLNKDIIVDEVRPVAHQHMAMLTAAGVAPAKALAIAAHVCALIYSDSFDKAMTRAFMAIEDSKDPRQDETLANEQAIT